MNIAKNPLQDTLLAGLEIHANISPAFAEILTPAALTFLVSLARKF